MSYHDVLVFGSAGAQCHDCDWSYSPGCGNNVLERVIDAAGKHRKDTIVYPEPHTPPVTIGVGPQVALGDLPCICSTPECRCSAQRPDLHEGWLKVTVENHRGETQTWVLGRYDAMKLEIPDYDERCRIRQGSASSAEFWVERDGPLDPI